MTNETKTEDTKPPRSIGATIASTVWAMLSLHETPEGFFADFSNNMFGTIRTAYMAGKASEGGADDYHAYAAKVFTNLAQLLTQVLCQTLSESQGAAFVSFKAKFFDKLEPELHRFAAKFDKPAKPEHEELDRILVAMVAAMTKARAGNAGNTGSVH